MSQTAPSTQPPKDFTEVKPGAVYTVADVAGLLKLKTDAIRDWVRDGKLAALPRPSPKAPIRILGSAVLAMLGEQARSLPGPSETKAERKKRSEEAMDEMRRLGKQPRHTR